MNSWDMPLCRYLHKPLQVLWFSVEEWYLLIMIYVGGLVTDPIIWILVIPAIFMAIPAMRKKQRSHYKHLLLVAGFKELTGYPPPISGRFYE